MFDASAKPPHSLSPLAVQTRRATGTRFPLHGFHTLTSARRFRKKPEKKRLGNLILGDHLKTHTHKIFLQGSPDLIESARGVGSPLPNFVPRSPTRVRGTPLTRSDYLRWFPAKPAWSQGRPRARWVKMRCPRRVINPWSVNKTPPPHAKHAQAFFGFRKDRASSLVVPF